MSVSVSSLEVLTIWTTPTTSSSGEISKRCVATGSGSTGAGGGAGGGGGAACFIGCNREHAVTRTQRQAAAAARIWESFMVWIMTSRGLRRSELSAFYYIANIP